VAVDRVLRRVLSGTADAAIRFEDLCHLLENLGFEKRVRGSHHMFRKSGIAAKINLQKAGSQAKPYQVKQVRAIILEAKLGGE
jgi:predicted RNA binding protein YcfA (HicA-like mRNA interferase family)